MTREASALFVMGSPRSGTSALAWALAEHPALWTAAESDWLGMLLGGNRLRHVYERATRRGPRQWLSQNEVGFEEWAAAIGSGIDRLYRDRSAGLAWVEQTPSSVLHVDALAALFPDARFLHLVRHGDQVVDSLIHSGFDIAPARSFRKACEAWVLHVRAGVDAERSHPQRVLRVRHERIVLEPEKVCSEVFAFAGIAEAPAAASFLRERRVNSSFPEARSGALGDAFARRPAHDWGPWRRRRFRRIAGPLMRELGFE